MDIRLKKVIFIVIAFLSTIYSNAYTPDGGTWIREILIGTTNNHFYTYTIKRVNPGSYYQYTDSVFLLKKSNLNGKIIESQTLRAISHIDTSTYDTWIHPDAVKNPAHMENYLKKEKVQFAIPIGAKKHPFKLNLEGISFYENKISEKLIDFNVIKNSMPWIKKFNIEKEFEPEFEIIESYREGGYIYLLLKKGYADLGYLSGVIPISVKFYNEAYNRMVKKVKNFNDRH